MTNSRTCIAFEIFEKQSKLQLTHRDTFVWSHEHRFAGALDAVGFHPDKGFVAIDWKTSNRFQLTYALQVAAYSLAWNEMHPDQPLESALVVKFDKTHAKYETMSVKSLADCQQHFLAALQLWRALRGERLSNLLTPVSFAAPRTLGDATASDYVKSDAVSESKVSTAQEIIDSQKQQSADALHDDTLSADDLRDEDVENEPQPNL